MGFQGTACKLLHMHCECGNGVDWHLVQVRVCVHTVHCMGCKSVSYFYTVCTYSVRYAP